MHLKGLAAGTSETPYEITYQVCNTTFKHEPFTREKNLNQNVSKNFTTNLPQVPILHYGFFKETMLK
jgi:hypothetical protein